MCRGVARNRLDPRLHLLSHFALVAALGAFAAAKNVTARYAPTPCPTLRNRRLPGLCTPTPRETERRFPREGWQPVCNQEPRKTRKYFAMSGGSPHATRPLASGRSL